MQLDVNNIDIRAAIRNIIQFVIDRNWCFRHLKLDKAMLKDGRTRLLCKVCKLQRVCNLDDTWKWTYVSQDGEWRDELSREIARWIYSYKSIKHYKGFYLETGGLVEVKQRVERIFTTNEGVFLMRNFLLIPHI